MAPSREEVLHIARLLLQMRVGLLSSAVLFAPSFWNQPTENHHCAVCVKIFPATFFNADFLFPGNLADPSFHLP